MHFFLIPANVVLFGAVLTLANCPVGTFDIWSQWDRCSASCGGGIQKRWQSLCCPPDTYGQWSDCRATYNLTEKFNFDYKSCNQICAHGTFIAGRCSCDPGYNDTCCIIRHPIVSTQIVFGDLTTRPSTNTVTETTRPSTSTTTVTTSPSMSTSTVTTETKPFRITTDNTSSILRLTTTTDYSSSQQAQNSSSAAYADINVLLIIFGSVTVGSATLLVIFILALKKRKIIPEKADVTEMGETVAVKN